MLDLVGNEVRLVTMSLVATAYMVQMYVHNAAAHAPLGAPQVRGALAAPASARAYLERLSFEYPTLSLPLFCY